MGSWVSRDENLIRWCWWWCYCCTSFWVLMMMMGSLRHCSASPSVNLRQLNLSSQQWRRFRGRERAGEEAPSPGGTFIPSVNYTRMQNSWSEGDLHESSSFSLIAPTRTQNEVQVRYDADGDDDNGADDCSQFVLPRRGLLFGEAVIRSRSCDTLEINYKGIRSFLTCCNSLS